MGKNKQKQEKTTNQAGASQNMGHDRNLPHGANKGGGQGTK